MQAEAQQSHTYSLGWCTTCGVPRYDCAEFDESKHPRDESGRWTDDGVYAAPTKTSVDIKGQAASLASVAQKVYDAWDENEDEYAGGGICHLIASEIAGHLGEQGIDATTVSAQVGEQHVWVVAKLKDGVYEIDIPPGVYETGGGYSWKKIKDVTIDKSDIVVSRLDSDPDSFGQYVDLSESFDESKHPRDEQGRWTDDGGTSAGGSSSRVPNIQKRWHITSDPNFRPDPNYRPELNSIAGDMIENPPAGLFVTEHPEYWKNGHGYERAYVAEVEGDQTDPPGTVMHKGKEGFMQGDIKVRRVLPLDEYAREAYGETGWVEDYFGAPRKKMPPGYVGRSVAEMSPGQIAEWERKFQEYFERPDGPHPKRKRRDLSGFNESQPRDEDGRWAETGGVPSAKTDAAVKALKRVGHITTDPDRTFFLLPDGTRISAGGMNSHGKLAAAAGYPDLNKLIGAGIVRYVPGVGIQATSGSLTEAQAQVIADDWNARYAGDHDWNKIHIDAVDPDDWRSEAFNRVTADRLRSFVNIRKDLAGFNENQDRDENGRWAETGASGNGDTRDQTKSHAFKAWFGESKVIDWLTKKPKVVYHGTTEDFEEFESPDAEFSTHGSSDSGIGVFFAAAPSDASYFTEEGIGSPFASGKHVKGANIVPAYLSIQNPKVYETQEDYFADVNDPSAESNRREFSDGEILRNRLESEGHDGIIIRESQMDGRNKPSSAWYIVFDPSQIKSAIGNSGTFDPKDPRIHMSADFDESKHPRDDDGKFTDGVGTPHVSAADIADIAIDIKKKVGSSLAELDLRLRANGDVHLETIAARRSGYGAGTEAMEYLTKWADANSVRLVLSPSEKGYQPVERGPKTTSPARLEEFYRRFGFKPNNGRDFSISDRMIRDPKPKVSSLSGEFDEALHPRDQSGKFTDGNSTVDRLERAYPDVAARYAQHSGTEMGSVGSHTRDVSQGWARQMPPKTLAPISKRWGHDLGPLLSATIALHDIGKGEANARGGYQHAHTVPVLQYVLGAEGFEERDIRLAAELVNHDLIGKLVRTDTRDTVVASTVAQAMRAKADAVGMPLDDFVTLQTAYFLADASAYPYVQKNALRQRADGSWELRDRSRLDAMLALLTRKDLAGFDESQARDEHGRWADTGSSGDLKSWIGKSTVVDAQGRPRVMYHSTTSDFEEFRPFTHFGTSGAANDRSDTLTDFFTDVLKRPDRATGARLIPVYLKVENPLRMPDLAALDSQSGTLFEEAEADFKSRYDEDEQQYRIESGDAPSPASWESETDLSEWLYRNDVIDQDEFWDVQYSPMRAMQLLQSKGYDGIVYNNVVEDPGNDSYIVFDPAQVKRVADVPHSPKRLSDRGGTTDLAGFDESQPRDEHGRWTGGGDSSPIGMRVAGDLIGGERRVAAISERAVKVAQQLGFPDSRIVVVDKPPRKFEVSGMQFSEGGHFNPKTGDIEINARSITSGADEQAYEGLVAHEIAHAQYDVVFKEMEREHKDLSDMAMNKARDAEYGFYFSQKSGVIRPGREAALAKKYPASAAFAKTWGDGYLIVRGDKATEAWPDVATQQMMRDDGVSEYSRAYWGKTSSDLVQYPVTDMPLAVNETLSEIARYDYQSRRGIPWNGTVPSRSWQRFSKDIKDTYALLTKRKKADA